MTRLSVDVPKLKEYMIERGISPADLARKMGVSRAAVSRVLNNDRGAGSAFIGSLTEALPDAWSEGVIFLDTGSRRVTLNVQSVTGVR